MKGADRTDVLMAAVAVSVVVHALLMFFIAPRVMSRSVVETERGRRAPMNVRESPPSKELLKVELLKDVPAVRDAPAAEIDDLGMAAAFASIPEKDDERVLPRFSNPALSESVRRVEEVAPVFSEKVELVERKPDLSPAIERYSASTVSSSDGVPSLGVDRGASVVVPSFVAASSPETVGMPNQEVAKLAPEPVAESEFKPSDTVLNFVDEKVVEAEKEAVRAIVNAPSARELASVVNCRLARQTVGDWTYFSLEFSAKGDSLPAVPKDLVLLLDASGSIGTERLVSCRKAAKRILRTAMNTGDRFNLVAFRDRFSYAFRSWQECTASTYDAADRWLANQAPHGRTDVFSTISSVLTLPRDPKRPIVAVVVTDGDANLGVSRTAEIISRFSNLNDGLVSVYMYGVRGSSNLELIDVLTRGNRGESVVHEGSRWRAGEGLEGLAERFRDPVLTDLRIVFASPCAVTAFPRSLKNIYTASSLKIVGRLPSAKRELAFSLRGQAAGVAYESFFRIPIGSSSVDSTLSGLFAEESAIDSRLK